MTPTSREHEEFTPAARLRGVELSVIRKLYDRALELGDFVNLGLGEPDLPLPEVVRRAAERALRERSVVGYTPNAGLPALRRAIAGSYGPDGYGPDNVCVTCGSQEALWIVLQTLVDPGDEVLVPDPGFVSYPACVRLVGGNPVPYRLPAARGFALDPDDLAARLSARTRAVVVNSPSNPTGQALGRAEVDAVASLLREAEAEHGRPVWLISDEIYRELYYDERPPSAADLPDPSRTVVVSGLSKSMCMTGWRVGWVLGPRELLRHAIAVHQYTAICAPTLSQLAGLAAFTPEGARAREQIRAVLGQRRERVLGFARDEAEIGCTVPAGAFYVLLDIGGRAGGDCGEVARQLLEEERVLTIPGGGFGEESRGTLRISFATDAETLDAGLRRLGRGLRRLGG